MYCIICCKFTCVESLSWLWSSRWAQGSHDTYELPSVPEFHDLSVVMELIEFSNGRPEEYSALPEHSRAFSLVRLTDLMGVDGYLTLMAAKLDVPANRINNSNSIKTVRAIIRNHYRASAASGRKFEGLCRKCRRPLAACPPEWSRVTTTLCYQQQIHSDCQVTVMYYLRAVRCHLFVCRLLTSYIIPRVFSSWSLPFTCKATSATLLWRRLPCTVPCRIIRRQMQLLLNAT